MNQWEIFDYLKTGTVVSARSLANHFNIQQSVAKKGLNRLMKIEGVSCRIKKVKKTQNGYETVVRFNIYWLNSRNNI